MVYRVVAAKCILCVSYLTKGLSFNSKNGLHTQLLHTFSQEVDDHFRWTLDIWNRCDGLYFQMTSFIYCVICIKLIIRGRVLSNIWKLFSWQQIDTSCEKYMSVLISRLFHWAFGLRRRVKLMVYCQVMGVFFGRHNLGMQSICLIYCTDYTVCYSLPSNCCQQHHFNLTQSSSIFICVENIFNRDFLHFMFLPPFYPLRKPDRQSSW